MIALATVSLVVAVAGTAVSALARHRAGAVARTAAVLGAIGGAVALTGDPLVLGSRTVFDVVVDEVTVAPHRLAALIGVALLLAWRPPTGLGRCLLVAAGGAAAALSLPAVGFVADPNPWALVVAAAALAVIGLGVGDGAVTPILFAVAVAVAAFVVDDPEVAAGVVLAAAGVVALGAAAGRAAPMVTSPGVVALLAAALTRWPERDVLRVADLDFVRVGLGAAVVSLLGAVVVRRTTATAPLAVAAVPAAVSMVGLDPALHGGAFLLLAGAVLGVVSDRRLGAVALAPGATVLAAALVPTDVPTEGAVGAAVLVLAVVAAVARPRAANAAGGGGPAAPGTRWEHLWVVPAIAFAALPLWGWSTTTPGDDYRQATLVGVAAAVLVCALLAADRLRSLAPAVRTPRPAVAVVAAAEAAATDVTGDPAGRLHQHAEAEERHEVDRPADDDGTDTFADGDAVDLPDIDADAGGDGDDAASADTPLDEGAAATTGRAQSAPDPDSADPDNADPDSADLDSADPDSADPDSADLDSADLDGAGPGDPGRETDPDTASSRSLGRVRATVRRTAVNAGSGRRTGTLGARRSSTVDPADGPDEAPPHTGLTPEADPEGT